MPAARSNYALSDIVSFMYESCPFWCLGSFSNMLRIWWKLDYRSKVSTASMLEPAKKSDIATTDAAGYATEGL